jgi:hypothetical protein
VASSSGGSHLFVLVETLLQPPERGKKRKEKSETKRAVKFNEVQLNSNRK